MANTDAEIINGYVVVTDRPDDRGIGRIILAVHPTKWNGNPEYVVARVALRHHNPTVWYAGDYIGDFDKAVKKYKSR